MSVLGTQRREGHSVDADHLEPTHRGPQARPYLDPRPIPATEGQVDLAAADRLELGRSNQHLSRLDALAMRS